MRITESIGVKGIFIILTVALVVSVVAFGITYSLRFSDGYTEGKNTYPVHAVTLNELKTIIANETSMRKTWSTSSPIANINLLKDLYSRNVCCTSAIINLNNDSMFLACVVVKTTDQGLVVVNSWNTKITPYQNFIAGYNLDGYVVNSIVVAWTWDLQQQ
jgi:hypothetical protein